MNRHLLKVGIVLTAGFFLSGCFAIVIDPTEGLSIVIDTTAYDHSATFNFGVVDPDGDAASVTADITNVTESDVTVTQAVIGGAPFSLQAPTLPAAIAAGETVTVTLTYDPTESGTSSSTLTVRIEGIDIAFVLNLVGEGNLAPRAYDGVRVTGAGDADANGLYLHDGTLNTTFSFGPLSYYVLPGTDYRIFGQETEGVDWYLGTSDDPGSAFYEIRGRGTTGPTGDVADWFVTLDGTSPAPSTLGPFNMPFDAFPIADQPFSVNYFYEDPEGDAEGESTFRWFLSDTSDPDGTYTLVTEGTSDSYTPTSAHEGRFFKVEVTPVAAGGTASGVPVTIGPSAPVSL